MKDYAHYTKVLFPVRSAMLTLLLALAKTLIGVTLVIELYLMYAGSDRMVVIGFCALMLAAVFGVWVRSKDIVRCPNCDLAMKLVLIDFPRDELRKTELYAIYPKDEDPDAIYFRDEDGVKNRLMRHIAVCEKCQSYTLLDNKIFASVDENNRVVRNPGLSPRTLIRVKSPVKKARGSSDALQ